ncbi:MAG: anti-sigma factor family protein [bacterium]
MHCDVKPEALYRLVDRELPPSEALRIEGHLKGCSKCQSLYERLLVENRNLIRSLKVKPLDEYEIRSLEKRLLLHIDPPCSS